MYIYKSWLIAYVKCMLNTIFTNVLSAMKDAFTDTSEHTRGGCSSKHTGPVRLTASATAPREQLGVRWFVQDFSHDLLTLETQPTTFRSYTKCSNHQATSNPNTKIQSELQWRHETT